MKKNSKCRSWFLGVGLVSVVLLGFTAYLTIPGRGRLPELPEPDYWPTNGWERVSPETQPRDYASSRRMALPSIAC